MKFEDVQRGYANLWAKAQIRPERRAAAEAVAKHITLSKARFKSAADRVGCPWWFVAVVCELEAGGKFTGHLHNGDPLTARTVHVPDGRPRTGAPPFTWEASANDALRFQGIDKVASWSIPRSLFEWERYNGFGYAAHNVNSPYLWSFTTLYDKGKFVSDGVFDADAVSGQCGAAAILRAMLDLGIVEDSALSDLKDFVSQFSPFAPLIATAIGGPAAGLAVKALAEAVGADPKAQPEDVHDKLTALPASQIGDAIKAAEKIMNTLQPSTVNAAPQAAPAPSPAAPIASTPAALPKLSTGPLAFLDGYKTYLGAAICVAGFAAFYLHYITADVSNAIISLGAGIGGVGLVDRWQKARAIIPVIPALPAQS